MVNHVVLYHGFLSVCDFFFLLLKVTHPLLGEKKTQTNIYRSMKKKTKISPNFTTMRQ